MVQRRILVVLLVVALVLPIAFLILHVMGSLLEAMQDPAGRAFLVRTNQVLGVLWGLDLVVLVLMLTLQSLLPPSSRG